MATPANLAEIPLVDVNGELLISGAIYYVNSKMSLVPHHPLDTGVDPLADQAAAFPAYWRPVPQNWKALDFYRIRELFPLPIPSARLDHALKKLLVPGIRTGGKSFRKDIAEAHATMGQWLKDNPEA